MDRLLHGQVRVEWCSGSMLVKHVNRNFTFSADSIGPDIDSQWLAIGKHQWGFSTISCVFKGRPTDM